MDSGDSQKKYLDATDDGRISMYTAKTTTVAGGKRFEDTTNYIPPPGYNGVPPEKYVRRPFELRIWVLTMSSQDPLLMRLPITLGEPFSLLVLGLGLEIVAGLSQRWNGVFVVRSRACPFS
jgi:hypothetical protein